MSGSEDVGGPEFEGQDVEGQDVEGQDVEGQDVAAYESVLRRFGEIVDVDISGVDRIGVPATSCTLAVDGRFRHLANGYGAVVAEARRSGLGELAEGVLSAERVRQLLAASTSGSYRELVRRHGSARIADPRTLGLPAGTAYDDDRPLVWVALERVRTGEPVWVPADLVVSEPGELPGGEPLAPPITNGLGAGLDRERALNHGLLEILQRHTNGLRFRALDRRSAVIDPATLPDAVRTLAERLRDRGIEPVLKHAVTELGVCSTYAMGVDDAPGAAIMTTACGEAAHPDAEVSLTKALLEYANSRARKAFCFGPPELARRVAPPAYWNGLDPGPGEPRALDAMRGWADLSVAELARLTAPDRTRVVRFEEIVVADDPAPGSQSQLLAHLLERLGEHDVLAATIEVDGVWSARALVPGLEAEILSYGRIGELGVRESISADLDLVRVQAGPSGEHTAQVRLTAEAEERLGGRAWFSYPAAARIVGPLYPLYREPPRHSVAV